MKRILAPYLPTPRDAYETILDLGELKPGEVFYDLCAGDFNLVFRATKPPYNAKKSVGIEIRKEFITIAKEIVKKEALQDRVKIIHGDVLDPDIDISDAQLVYLFLTDEGNGRIRRKLERQLPDETKVISKDYFMPKWVYSGCKIVRAPVVVWGKTSPPIRHYFYLYKMSDVRKFQKI